MALTAAVLALLTPRTLTQTLGGTRDLSSAEFTSRYVVIIAGPFTNTNSRQTNVISISYGGQESDLPAAYQQRQCNEFMKLGLQGVSIVLASGDSGVGGTNGCIGSAGNIFRYTDLPFHVPRNRSNSLTAPISQRRARTSPLWEGRSFLVAEAHRTQRLPSPALAQVVASQTFILVPTTRARLSTHTSRTALHPTRLTLALTIRTLEQMVESGTLLAEAILT
jgi:hypothetical protein